MLLNSPEEKFYVREIAKLLRKNPSGVKRELDNLEKMGIVMAERVANLKYFRANTKSPLYGDLKKLITKSLGLPGAMKAVLRAAGAKSAFIYGPFAEGQPKNNTVDICVLGASADLQNGLQELEDDFQVKISALAMTEDEFNEKRKAEDEALKEILKSKKIVLLGRQL